MRKKFGGYTINVTKAKQENVIEDISIVSMELYGNIEIGIYIDYDTWREDWCLRHAFGDDYTNYRVLKIDQTLTFVKENGCNVEHNKVRITCEKRRV